MSTKEIFDEIYRSDKWAGTSKSGPGSNLAATAPIRERLPLLFEELGIRRLTDAPCGTAEWITLITARLDLYVGYDIVDEVVEAARNRFGDEKHLFSAVNILETVLPPSDAILCRDCLVHMPLASADRAIDNFQRSRTKYLITTTFPTVRQNTEARMGSWRPLNLQLPPFNLSKPIILVRDRIVIPDDRYADKSLGVWEIGAMR